MDYFKNYFADMDDREHFAVSYLAYNLRVIKTETISNGTLTKAFIYPREIYKEALFINAASVMLAHNHPSGNLKPSKQDIEITQSIKLGMELLELTLNDHIIVSGDRAVSLFEMGEFPDEKAYKDPKKAAMPINIAADEQMNMLNELPPCFENGDDIEWGDDD